MSDYLSDDRIALTLAFADAEVAARELARLALVHGGRDNVTAVIADVNVRTDPREGWLDYLPAASSAG